MAGELLLLGFSKSEPNLVGMAVGAVVVVALRLPLSAKAMISLALSFGKSSYTRIFPA